MRPIGEVVREAGGLAVVRADGADHPAIGAGVVDEGLEPVGRVVDVFGPVDRPYVGVTPAADVRIPTLVGRRVYERQA